MENITQVLQQTTFGFPADIAAVFKHGIKEMGKFCEARNIKKGFVFNPVYGWEKPEILKSFGLNPNMDGIPSRWYKECEIKETRIAKKDDYGRKTGEYEIKKEKIDTGRWQLGASENWLVYYNWKTSKLKQQIAVVCAKAV